MSTTVPDMNEFLPPDFDYDGDNKTGNDTGSKAKSTRKPRTSRKPQPPPLTSTPKKEPTTDEIAKCMGEVLSLTAIVHSLPQVPNLYCEYCRDHILETAPQTGKDLAKLSEEHPALRSALGGITKFFAGMSLAGSLGNLYGPSAVHHGPKILEPARVMYPNMPPRKPKAAKKPRAKGGVTHAHSTASAGTASPTPESPPDTV